MTEEFQRGVIPLARYQEQQLPEYQDNPLISALPPIPDLQEVVDHTLFPLYAPFIPPERRTDLFQAMLAPDRPTIGLSGASTALVKWPDWLRYCPICFEDMAARYGEPYWRRALLQS